jgi:hypothetical protein
VIVRLGVGAGVEQMAVDRPGGWSTNRRIDESTNRRIDGRDDPSGAGIGGRHAIRRPAERAARETPTEADVAAHIRRKGQE